MNHELPDLFLFAAGRRVTDQASWPGRRQELLEQILTIEYGPLPPAPAAVEAELLHTHLVPRFGNARHSQYRLTTGPTPRFSFLLDLMIPAGNDPFPVILDGDGCWRYVTDAITSAVLERRYVLAMFNRVEIVPDVDHQQPGEYGALAAWAWGYHRCIDCLVTLPCVNAQQIVATGHSRGGKAALLAGATDERIALTVPNNSGCCGAGCFRYQGPGSETLADILRGFPQWFSPRLHEYVGREHELPFDQHSLKALLAPRALLTTEALDDAWANPTGTWETHCAAAEVYRFLSAPVQIAIHFRPGRHEHNHADWLTLLEFADAKFRQRPITLPYNRNPWPPN